MTISKPYHFDLLKFSESSGDGHVVWLCLKPEHGLFEPVSYTHLDVYKRQELEMARNDGTYKKVQGKYANPVLLIIDEWLLLKPTESEQHDILELLHRRRRKSSTIFCSQYDSNGWYDQLGGDDSPLSEAILDRIKHDAYKINIIPTDPTNYRSMREMCIRDRVPIKQAYAGLCPYPKGASPQWSEQETPLDRVP